MSKKRDSVNEGWISWKGYERICGTKIVNVLLLNRLLYRRKKVKWTKKCIIKWKLMFQYFKKCLENKEIISRSHEVWRVKNTIYSVKMLTRLR